jgi:hypothetical protein
MANANKANPSRPRRRGSAEAGVSKRAVRATAEPDPRALVRALSREVGQLPRLQAELDGAEKTIGDLRRQIDDQRKLSAAMQASLTRLVETLHAINAISHGKRTDRRLAKAQKLAGLALKRVENNQPPAGRRTSRTARGASGR